MHLCATWDCASISAFAMAAFVPATSLAAAAPPITETTPSAALTGLTAVEEYDLTHSTLRARYEASIEALRRDVLSDKLAVARLRHRLGTLLSGASQNGNARMWASAIHAFHSFDNATKATADDFGNPISLQRSPTMEGIALDREVRGARMKAVARERFLNELKRLEPIPKVVHVTWPRHIDVANMSGQPILREVCACVCQHAAPRPSQLSPLALSFTITQGIQNLLAVNPGWRVEVRRAERKASISIGPT